jgi:hypothetical protein
MKQRLKKFCIIQLNFPQLLIIPVHYQNNLKDGFTDAETTSTTEISLLPHIGY